MVDTLRAAFEAAHPGHRMAVTTSGSGAILEMARRGDLAVVITHLPEEERRLVDEGALTDRTAVMHNHFLIAGPPGDPARVREAADPVEAFRRIAAAGAPFVSRGDGSGTHARERALWQHAGLDPAPADPWYTEAGVGMGQTLMLAGERRAYTLADPATFTVLRAAAELEPLSSPVPALINIYSVSLPTGGDQSEAARRFMEWVTGPDARAIIRRFGVETYGVPLYIPGEPDPGL